MLRKRDEVRKLKDAVRGRREEALISKIVRACQDKDVWTMLILIRVKWDEEMEEKS